MTLACADLQAERRIASRQLWAGTFDFAQFETAKHEFGCSIRTDGVGVRLLMESPERPTKSGEVIFCINQTHCAVAELTFKVLHGGMQ